MGKLEYIGVTLPVKTSKEGERDTNQQNFITNARNNKNALAHFHTRQFVSIESSAKSLFISDKS